MTSPIDYSVDEIPAEDFGPDPQAVPPDDKPPSEGKKKAQEFIGTLGKNKKARGGPRRLTVKDRDKIVSLYASIAMPVMMFKPATGQAIAENTESCADAWMQLAEENDSVRRTLLMLIEGGAWGAVIAAHLPILLTLAPENFMTNFKFAQQMGAEAVHPESPESEYMNRDTHE